MDIVLIFNGLGNQMSQYAFYLAKKKYIPKTQCIFYTSDANHNGYELDRLFGIDIPGFKHSKFYVSLFNFLNNRNIFNRVMKKLLAALCIVRIYREDIQNYNFNSSVFKKGNALINYYWGGWHSYKYVDEVKEKVLSLYHFNDKNFSSKTNGILSKVRNTNSVSIHIRRGDYTKKENFLWGGVATLDYYKKVLSLFTNLQEYSFFVFSDDIAWVRENLPLPNAYYVDWNRGCDSWQDMYIMSNCQVNINPNSTFSWWASYLNSRNDKTVYVPDHFVVTQKSKDFYPQDWKQIEVYINEVIK